ARASPRCGRARWRRRDDARLRLEENPLPRELRATAPRWTRTRSASGTREVRRDGSLGEKNEPAACGTRGVLLLEEHADHHERVEADPAASLVSAAHGSRPGGTPGLGVWVLLD